MFLHDRSDYKSGWQLEKEWDEAQTKKRMALEAAANKLNSEPNEAKEGETSEEKADDQLPFACYVCREEFKRPVVTVCGHYFCGKCAMQQCASKCVICSKKTMGVFNVARKLVKKLEAKK